MSSRPEIASLSVQILFLIKSCALPSQTSVPCEKPEILTKSLKQSG